jgi:uncharacterized protein YegL
MRKNYDYDWFNRSRDNDYTFYDSSKRLFDWDSGLDSFSSYFRAKNPASDAGKLLGSMFSVIGVNMKNHKFVGTAQAAKSLLEDATMATAKGVVQIPINMLRDEKGEYVEDTKVIDAFYGASIQNAAMAAMQTRPEYLDSLAVRTLKNPELTNTEAYVTSLLNTERIDKKLGDDFPGYLKFVQKYKNHAYSNASEKESFEELMKDRGARLLDLVTKMLRYPADVTEEELTEFAEPIEKIKDYMQRNGGIPNTYKKCKEMGAGLSKLLYEIEPPPPSGGGGSDDKDGDSGENKGDGGGDSSGKAPSAGKKGSTPMDAAAREMMKDIINADMSESDMSSESVKDMEEFDKSSVEADGYSEEGEAYKSKIEYRTVSGDKAKYLDVRSKIDMSKAQTIARLFARKNKDYKFSLKSMRSGRLDTEKLAEAVQGVSTIYERMGEVKTNKICVGVLIDESGSMGGSKIEKARQAAVFINEIFKKIGNVELFIYGHTADVDETGTTQIYVYREPGKATDMYALGSCRARIENRDGDAILAAGMRMRKLTQNAGILFVISDGEPCAHDYHGAASVEDTKRKVIMTENLGLQVIQIAIDSSVRSERMFKHYIKMTDIANLPTDMVKFLSKKIDHLIKEKVFI